MFLFIIKVKKEKNSYTQLGDKGGILIRPMGHLEEPVRPNSQRPGDVSRDRLTWQTLVLTSTWHQLSFQIDLLYLHYTLIFIYR